MNVQYRTHNYSYMFVTIIDNSLLMIEFGVLSFETKDIKSI